MRLRGWLLWSASLLASGCPSAASDDGSNGEGSTESGSTSNTPTTGSNGDDSVDTGDGGTDTAADTSVDTTAADESATDTMASDTDPPGCGGGTRQCAEVVPNWTGPVAVLRAGWPDDTLGCGGAFANNAYEGSIGPDTGEHTCECECVPPPDDEVLCGDALLETWSNSSCAGTPLTTSTLDAFNCNNFAFTNFPGSHYVEVTPSMVAGSQSPPCTPLGTAEIGTPVFETSIVACASDDIGMLGEDGCESDSVCVPSPLTPFAGELCIFREGDHTCPEGAPYSERSLAYSGITDNRSCLTCDCDDLEGTCVMGTSQLFDNNTCSGPIIIGSFVDPDCEQVAPTTSIVDSIQSSQLGDVTFCDPATGTNEPQGEAVLEDPVTICCTPG